MVKFNFSRFVFGLLLLVGGLSQSFAQTITGRITDENGQPLAGASVGIEGSAKGALTDLDGNFEIKNVPPGEYTINTTFVGYKSSSQTVTVNEYGVARENSSVDFTLAEDLMGLEQVVVTGSFNPQSRLESTVSVTTLDRKMIDQQVPRSTGDLIDAIPGFYVESSLGEAANNIYPRGLPVGTGGSRYTALREDGLNNFEISDKVFFGSDGFTKIDLTVDRVEGLRGGNAVVFASNTPGGIINFISKTGGADLSGQVRATLGSQGLYRMDVNVGGPLTEDKKWRFNIGGFYRYDKGLKNLSGPANVGGQIKANVTRLFDNDKGYIRFFLKSLQDNITVFTPVPYQNNGNPTAIPGGPDLLYGTLIPTGQYGISLQDPQLPGQFRTRDLNQTTRGTFNSIGAELQLNLGNGWMLNNKIRYVNAYNNNNVVQLISNPILGQTYVNTLAAAGYSQGIYNYTNPGTVTGQNYQPGGIRGENIPLAALSGASASPNGGILRDGINDNGLILPLGLFAVDSYNTNLLNNLQISKQIGGHSITAGAYFSQYNSKEYWSFNSLLTDVRDNPRLIDVSYNGLSPLSPLGPTVNLTSNGVLSSNFQYEYSNTTNYTVAGFIGDEWKVSDRLNISMGFRYEVNQARGSLQNTGRRSVTPIAPNPAAGSFVVGSPSYIVLPGSGGLDSNPSTLFDNNADVPVNGYTYYDITYEVWGANLGINYKIGDDQAIFASASRGTRYSNSQNFLANKDQYNPTTGQPINLRNPVEEILQGEIGYRFSNTKFGVTATVFGTQLKEIGRAHV